MRTHVLEKTHARRFMEDLLQVTKIQKQPRCPAATEWVNKSWFHHTVYYYSENSKLLTHAMWADLTDVMLNKRKPYKHTKVNILHDFNNRSENY